MKIKIQDLLQLLYSAVCFLILAGVISLFFPAKLTAAEKMDPNTAGSKKTDAPSGESRKDQNTRSGFDRLVREFQDPPHEFTLMPFWFWNDRLTKREIIRQIDDFEKHGVYGFTIHPRIGLPKETEWLGAEMIDMMRTALQEAQKRKMYVMLYDDGMYPSGSASGQVVAENPEYAARGFIKFELKKGEPLPKTGPDAKPVIEIARSEGGRTIIYDMFSEGKIRGIHYAGPENVKNPREDLPPAADLLNPKAVQCFIRLVYQRYYDEFKPYFNGTIVGIFTDEPSILGRGSKRGMVEGNLTGLKEVNKILGYDFTPYLPELWSKNSLKQKEFRQALEQVLEETYYGQISQWCRKHGVAFAGHPARSSDLGLLRKMDIPGQDIVWRYIEPGEKAFDPTHSMMGKVTSSAMLHAGKRRNLNEVYGAYGHDFTFEEMNWIANWCFVRGHNMLLPHAFFYSVRGPRFDERPPDVGPNSVWWGKYKPYADFCRRLSWLNTDSLPKIRLAILTDAHNASADGTRALFEHQLDFNYLELRDLGDRAATDSKGVHIAGMNYDLLILPPVDSVPKKSLPALAKLAENGRLIRYKNDLPHHTPTAIQKNSANNNRSAADPVSATVLTTEKSDTAAIRKSPAVENDNELVRLIEKKLYFDLRLTPAAPEIRVRHVIKYGYHFYILFNEVQTDVTVKIQTAVSGDKRWWDPVTGNLSKYKEEPIHFKPFELKILGILEK